MNIKELTATEREECRKTAKQNKPGNLKDECDDPENYRRTVKLRNSRARRRQKLKPLLIK